jgi:hypothetical protein
MNTTAQTKIRAACYRSIFATAVVASLLLATVPGLRAQGSRKDDIVFGPEGRPLPGATVRVCQPSATGTPCSPLATIYTDATLTVTATNPLQTDGLGNYHFYAAAGRYEIQISSPQISGTITQPDVILPADLSSSSSGNNISAFGLTLGGNLSVAGNATISGTLTTSSFNPGSFSPTSLNVSGNSTFAGPRPYMDVTSPQYGAIGDGGAEQTSGSISSGSNHLTVASAAGFKAGMGIHVDGAGTSGDVFLATITAIAGNVLTLSANAGASVTGAPVQNDDTLAIRAAIANYCSQVNSNSGGGSLYFPPGNYLYSQPQTSNSAGVAFAAGCANIHFLGGNSGEHNGTPFVEPPTSSILVHCGSSPNAHAGFELAYPNGNITFENLVITGCNKAVYVAGANVIRFNNTFLGTSASGLTDNSALHIADTFWIWMEHGGLNSNNTGVPTLLMTGDNCSGCYAGVGNVYMSDTLLSNGPITYIQRGTATGEPSGHWVFRNITQESGAGDLIQITNPSASIFPSVGPITLDDVQQADNSSTSAALVNLNSSNTTLSGLYINNSFSGAGGANAPAVKITAGSIDHYFITGCDVGCTSQIWNSSGNPMGSGVAQSTSGFDVTTDTTNVERLITSPLSFAYNVDGTGPAARFTQSGSSYASYGIDAANGYMFGSKTQAGWNAQIFQNTAPNIDIAFAADYPPTGVAATVSNTGGTLGTGTYYIYMATTTSSTCNTTTGMSAPSNLVGPLTVGAGVTTAQFNVTWTPAAAGASTIQGYCVFGGTSNQYNKFDAVSTLVSGASTASAAIGTFPNTPGVFPITYVMVPEHHITPTYASFNGAATPNPSASAPYSAPCIVTMACGASLAVNPVESDSFARANASTLGPNWSANTGQMNISSNTATETSTNFGVSSYTAQNFSSDQFSRATINTFANGAGDLVMAVARAQSGANTYYGLDCLNGQLQFLKTVAATVTTLTTMTFTCTVGSTIELDVAGSSPAYLVGLVNGVVKITYADSSSPLTGGAPGVSVWASTDSMTNWVGGSLPPGNGSQSILNQPNTWTQPQTFASPITSASLAVPNKIRTCNIVRGDQSGSALTTGNIQPQGSLCYVDAAGTVTQVVVMVDAGASTAQLGYRHNGSTTAITPTLTPATVSGITDHVACANTSGTAITVEGNSVTCSTLSNSSLAAGDFIETTAGAADGTTKRMSIAMTFTVN